MNNKIFFEAAIFACTCCGHKDEFLSIKEWAELVKGEGKDCGKSDVALFEPFLLHIYNEDENYIFPVVPDILQPKSFCTDHHGKDKLHWTEFVINCRYCDEYTMQFVEYTEGMYREAYEKFAIEESKLCAPDLWYDCKDGDRIMTSQFDFRAN